MSDAVSPSPVLALRHIAKSFDGAPALRDVSVAFSGGRIYALCGLNGSGKSTLIKIVTGVLAPDSGEVRLDGRPVQAAGARAMKAAGIHAIYQDLALFPNMSVADNITIGTMVDHPLRLLNGPAREEETRAALQRIKADLPLDAMVETLTTAQSQLVAIARALSGAARVLILDEPTASLTNREALQLFTVVRDLKQAGVAIIFVSHRYEEVASIADEAIILRDGQLVGAIDRAALTAERLHGAMAGEEQGQTSRAALAAPQETPLLEVRGLTLGGAFQDIDLTIRKGEVLGITGLLGSGRTAFAQTLFGLHRPDKGEIRLDGRVLRLRSNLDAIAAGIAYVPEDRLRLGLILDASIRDNIALPMRGQLTDRFGLTDSGAVARFVDRLIRAMRIKLRDAGDPVTTLSGGNQQRVVLAKWLGTQPKLLLLDSPTLGVDVTARQAIYQVIQDVSARGVAVLLISDEVEEVWSNSHRIRIMKEGRLGPASDPDETSIAQLSDRVHA